MAQLPTSLTLAPVQRTLWETVFLFLVGALASTVMLKIASIQYLELLYIVQFTVLAVAFFNARMQARVFRPLLLLAAGYGSIAVLSILLALTALRFTFYTEPDQGVLQLPVVITFSRVFELLIDAGAMLYLAGLFRARPETARFTMRIYYWFGVLSAIFSVLSYPLDRAGLISLGAYGDVHRFRGFYNEGGPYGLYVMTLLGVAWALVRLGWEPKRKTYVIMLLLISTLLMSQSKAALVAILFLFVIRSFFARNFRQRLVTIICGVAVLALVSQTFDLASKLRLWKEAGAKYERISHAHVGDPNVIEGRVAGLFIVPRMIAAHPLTGVGWGNYGILRNDPEYRGTAAWGEPDEPGMGVLALAAEIGLPLLAVLLLYLFLPYFWLRRLGVPEYVANLALLQPIAHIFGAQLNLTYPWIVTAFALGIGFGLKKQERAAEHPAELVTA
jgi:O-antigen ligase